MKTQTTILSIACLALGVPAFAGVLYTSGPVNGTINALAIDGPGGSFYEQTISNEFVATNSGTAGTLVFGEWVDSGDTPTTVDWAIGTSAFASDIASGSTGAVSFTYFGSDTPVGGSTYDIYTSQVSGLSGALIAGDTYYLTLSGGYDNLGEPAFWDENDGTSTCFFAYTGTNEGGCGYGGESFTISTGSTTPEPGSLMLFGSGMLLLAGALGRKISK